MGCTASKSIDADGVQFDAKVTDARENAGSVSDVSKSELSKNPAEGKQSLRTDCVSEDSFESARDRLFASGHEVGGGERGMVIAQPQPEASAHPRQIGNQQQPQNEITPFSEAPLSTEIAARQLHSTGLAQQQSGTIVSSAQPPLTTVPSTQPPLMTVSASQPPLTTVSASQPPLTTVSASQPPLPTVPASKPPLTTVPPAHPPQTTVPPAHLPQTTVSAAHPPQTTVPCAHPPQTIVPHAHPPQTTVPHAHLTQTAVSHVHPPQTTAPPVPALQFVPAAQSPLAQPEATPVTNPLEAFPNSWATRGNASLQQQQPGTPASTQWQQPRTPAWTHLQYPQTPASMQWPQDLQTPTSAHQYQQRSAPTPWQQNLQTPASAQWQPQTPASAPPSFANVASYHSAASYSHNASVASGAWQWSAEALTYEWVVPKEKKKATAMERKHKTKHSVKDANAIVKDGVRRDISSNISTIAVECIKMSF